MEDLHPDCNESYDMSVDLDIPSTSLNNEPLVLMLFLTSELANKAEITILSARDTTRA